MQDAASYAGGALSSGGKSAGRAGGNLVAAITEGPVLLGALGLAAGALLGALARRQSDQEEAALGGVAGQARDVATSLARQGFEQCNAVADAVVDKGRASADAHGLSGGKSAVQLVDAALSGDLAGDAKMVIQDVLTKPFEARPRPWEDPSKPAS